MLEFTTIMLAEGRGMLGVLLRSDFASRIFGGGDAVLYGMLIERCEGKYVLILVERVQRQ